MSNMIHQKMHKRSDECMKNSNKFTKFVRSKVFVYFSHNTAILFFSLFCTFMVLFYAFCNIFMQPFHATSSFSDLNLHCFSAKSEFCKKKLTKIIKQNLLKTEISVVQIIGKLLILKSDFLKLSVI